MSDDFIKQKIGRRSVLKGLAAAAGTITISMPNIARAASKGTIIVGTWGGDYARLLNKNIEKPLLIPQGWDVTQAQAGDPERRGKMLAERRLPRGSSDLQGLNGPNMYQVYQLGVTQKIDYSRVPNASHLLPSMKYEYGIGQIYSGMVPVFHSELSSKPTSYKDVFNPKFGDKLGVIDIQYQYNIVAAALAAGGSPTNLEPGKKLLLELRKAGVRIYPTNEAFAQGLKTNEIDIGIMWKARTVQWQNAGIKVDSSAPAEGALSYVSGFVIPKNAPDTAGAYAYLNAMLEPSAQEAFAKDMGYNATVDNAVIAPELNKRIGFTKAEIDNLKSLDFAYMTDHDVELKNWWDKDFKG